MGIRQMIRASLPENISEMRKEDILNRIIEKQSAEETVVKKNKPTRKVFISFAAAAVIAAAIIVPVVIFGGDGQTQRETAEGNGQSDLQFSEEMAGEDNETVVYLKNVVLSENMDIAVPTTMAVMEQAALVINEEEMKKIEENALEYGWQNINMTSTDIEGLYFIKSENVQGELMTDPPPEGAEIGPVSSEHHRAAELFLQESGLAALLEQKGMPTIIEEKSNATLFWSDVNGFRAGGYVRLGIEKEKIVADCKIYAMRQNPIEEAETVPLEQAVKRVFFIVSEGRFSGSEEIYTAVDVSLDYVRGIPMYKLTLENSSNNRELTAYALAIDESVVMSNDITKKEYVEFLELGF